MKKTILTITAMLMFVASIFAKSADADLIAMSKIYAEFHNADISPEAMAELRTINNAELATTKAFILQALTKNNQLLASKYLTVPDEKTLKQVYTLRLISWNIQKGLPRSNEDIMTELSLKRIDRLSSIEAYYDILFKAVGSKNKNVDLSKANFVLNNYMLVSPQEKGIFFLHMTEMMGEAVIAGMEVNKSNYKDALLVIDKFPQVNGQEYYKYVYFDFKDYKGKILPGAETSFKRHYLAKYYDVLMWHAVTLSQKGKYKDQLNDLVMTSILDQHELYDYATYPDAVAMIRQSINN